MPEWKKRRNEMQCLRENFEETREIQPARSECVGNKDALLENKIFFSNSVFYIKSWRHMKWEMKQDVSFPLCLLRTSDVKSDIS